MSRIPNKDTKKALRSSYGASLATKWNLLVILIDSLNISNMLLNWAIPSAEI